VTASKHAERNQRAAIDWQCQRLGRLYLLQLDMEQTKEMKYGNQILEMARIACATVPDDVCELMDISDDLFIKIRDSIHDHLGETTNNIEQ
jgi:hypothetical protein